MAGADSRTSNTFVHGRDTQEARTSLFVGASRVTLTSFEVGDTKLTRALVGQPGAKVIGSERTTTPWAHGNADTYRQFWGNPRLQEARREPFGRMLHAKIGVFERHGVEQFFIGTGNLTDTGLGVTAPTRYNFFPGVSGDRTQFNYFVAGTDPRVVSQFKKVLNSIEADRTPVSTENLIVTSPNAPNALARLSSLINDPNNHEPLYIASATLTNPRLIEAILAKARRGDQIYVGLGGTKEDEHRWQRSAAQALRADPRTRANIHVAYGLRPWHANVIAMGDLFAVGSNRYSRAGLEGTRGPDGARSFGTEVTYVDRDARTSQDIARHVRESFGFGLDRGLRREIDAQPAVTYKFTRYGTYMPAMTPMLDINASGKRDWAYVIDPATLFDEGVRRQYYWAAMTNPGHFRNPTTTQGRLMSHLYTEMFWAGQGKMPGRIPREVIREDQELMMPTHAEVLNGLLTGWAQERLGDRGAWWTNELTRKRGNRGPLGTLLVNAGMTLDRLNYQNAYQAGLGSDVYRPMEAQYYETYGNAARVVADTTFNLGSSLAIANMTVAMAGLWAGTWSRAGSVARYFHDVIQTAPRGARSPANAAAAEISSGIGRFANWYFHAEAQFTKSVVELLEPAMVQFRGQAGQEAADKIKAIYDMRESPRRLLFSDPDLANDLAMQLSGQSGTSGGARSVTMKQVPIGRSTFYEVAWATRMTYLERFRATSREVFGFMGRIPGLGWFANNVRVEADPYDEGISHLRRRGLGELARGRVGAARRTFGELFQHQQNVQGMRLYLHGEGGPGAANMLARRAVRGMMWGAVASWAVGNALAAPYGTMETQVDAQNRINNDMARGKGPVEYFGWRDYAPEDVFDLFPSVTGLVGRGVAWAAQFTAGLSMGMGFSAAAQRAEKMTSIPKSYGGHLALQTKAQARIGRLDPNDLLGSFQNFLGYGVEALTASVRDRQMQIQSRRHGDLFYKVVSKQMASTMQINELLRGADAIAKREGATPEELEKLELLRERAREWSGQREKATLTLTSSTGFRIGHLGIFGVWGGAVTSGTKTTFMASVIGTMPFEFGFGIKMPFFYSAPSARKNFQEWYNERLMPDDRTDALLRRAIDATGGEYGLVGSGTKAWMGLGYEPGSNWEALMRAGVDLTAIAQGSSAYGGLIAATYASAELAHWQAQRSEAARGLPQLTRTQRIGEYMRTGSSGGRIGYYGPSPYLADNLSSALVNWTTARGINPRWATGLGYVMRAPGAALRLPFVAPLAVPWAIGTGLQASGLGTRLFGRVDPSTGVRSPWLYRESRVAQMGRGYRAAVGLAGLGFMWYAGTQLSRAVDKSIFGDGLGEGGRQAFKRHNQEAALRLTGIPGIGTGLARAYLAIVDEKNMEAANPEDAMRFTTTPTERLLGGNEMLAAHRKGRMDPNMQGLWNSLWTSLSQSTSMLKFGGFQTGEFTLGQTGPNWAFDHTADPDRMEINAINYRWNFFNGWVAAGNNVSARINQPKEPTDINYYMASAIGADKKFLTTHMMPKKPAFMGKMFLASSAVYTASPALKIAMAVRHLKSRTVLGSWASEAKQHAGEMRPGAHRAQQLNFVVYTATRLNDKGQIMAQSYTGTERIARILAGLAGFEGPKKDWAHIVTQGSGVPGGKNPFKSLYDQQQGTGAWEMEDDEDALFADAPRAPGSSMLRDPLTSKNEAEFGLNFPNFQRTLYNQFAYFTMAAAAVTVIGSGMAFRSVHERFFRRTVDGFRYHNSVAQRVERYAPTTRARTMGAVLAPYDDRFGGHGRWVLTARGADLAFVELPMPGGHGVAQYGDAGGRPFTSSTRRGGGVVRTGFEKAKFFADAYNSIVEVYTSLPQRISTVGGATGALDKLEGRLSQIRRVSAHGLSTTEIDDVLTQVGDLRNRINHGRLSTARLDEALGREVELLARTTMQDLHRLANLQAPDGARVLRESGITGVRGWVGAAMATAGLREETIPSPIARARRGAGPSVDVTRVAHANDPTIAYGNTRRSFGDRLDDLRSWWGTRGRRAPMTVGRGLGYGMLGLQMVATALDAGRIMGGIGAEAAGSDYLNDQQREVFREEGVASTLGLGAVAVGGGIGWATTATMSLLGGALASTGVAGVAAAGGLMATGAGAAGLVIGAVAMVGLGMWGVPYALDSEDRRRRGENVGSTGNLAASTAGGARGFIQGAGALARNTLGAQFGNATVHSLTTAQLHLTNMLRTGAERVRPKDPNNYWSGLLSSTLMSLSNVTRDMVAPVERAFPEIIASEEGHSFSLYPLWQSKSPIWWGPNLKGGTGWIKDAWFGRERAKQEHMRITADPIGSSLPEMVSPDTLGILSSSNDDPLNINLKSLYMTTGKGAGGLGSAQTSRAFKWRPVEPVDFIIRRELERRSIMFEVGILGGVLRRRGYRQVGGTGYAGGFVGRPSIGRGGHGPNTGGDGRGSQVLPAGPGDVGPALAAANTLLGGGPNTPSVARWNPLVEAAAKKHGIPAGMLRSIMLLESGGRPDATSYAGAIGLMQVMPFHFKSRGISGDRRYDPATNIDVGASIFAGYYKQMQKRVAHLKLPQDRVLALAVASYNSGPGWNAYDRGEFPASWDGYSTAKSYSDTVMRYYNMTKINTKPVFTQAEIANVTKVMPEFLKGRSGMYLDTFLAARLGLSKDESNRLARKVRTSLYQQNKWLPMDDPAEWNGAPRTGKPSGLGNASMGIVPNADDKARSIMEAAGLIPATAFTAATTDNRYTDWRASHVKGVSYGAIPGLVGTSRTANKNTRAVLADNHLVPGFSKALNAFLAYAETHKVTGIGGQPIQANNAYRSPEVQAGLFADAVAKYGSAAAASRWVAPPYRSRHQHGDAIDFEGFHAFANTPAYSFLKKEGWRFGLYQPMSWEPWHWQYNKNLAEGAVDPFAKPETKAVYDLIKKEIDSGRYRGFDVSGLLRDRFGFSPERAETAHRAYEASMWPQGFYTGPTHEASGTPMEIAQRFPNAGRTSIYTAAEGGEASPLSDEQWETLKAIGVGALGLFAASKFISWRRSRAAALTATMPTPLTPTAPSLRVAGQRGWNRAGRTFGIGSGLQVLKPTSGQTTLVGNFVTGRAGWDPFFRQAFGPNEAGEHASRLVSYARAQLGPGETPPTAYAAVLSTQSVMKEVLGVDINSRGVQLVENLGGGTSRGRYMSGEEQPFVKLNLRVYEQLEGALRGRGNVGDSLHILLHEHIHGSYRRPMAAGQFMAEYDEAVRKFGFGSDARGHRVYSNLEESLTETITRAKFRTFADRLGFQSAQMLPDALGYKAQRVLFGHIMSNITQTAPTEGAGLALVEQLKYSTEIQNRYNVLARETLKAHGIQANKYVIRSLVNTYSGAMARLGTGNVPRTELVEQADQLGRQVNAQVSRLLNLGRAIQRRTVISQTNIPAARQDRFTGRHGQPIDARAGFRPTATPPVGTLEMIVPQAPQEVTVSREHVTRELFKTMGPLRADDTPRPQHRTAIPAYGEDMNPVRTPAALMQRLEATRPVVAQPTTSYSRGVGLSIVPRSMTAAVPTEISTVVPAVVPQTAAQPRWLQQTWGQVRNNRVAALGVSSAMAVLDVATLLDPHSTQEQRDRAKWNLGTVAGAASATVGSVWAQARGASARIVQGLGRLGGALGVAAIAPDVYSLTAGKTVEQRRQGGWNYFVGAATAFGVTALAGTAAVAGMAAVPAALVLAGAGLAIAGGMHVVDWASGNRISQGVGLAMQTGRDAIVAVPKMVGAAAGHVFETTRLAARSTGSSQPVTVRDQIVVVGDETPGVIAAVSAARQGAQVTLLAPLRAKDGLIGGLLTRGGLAYLDRNQAGLAPSNPYYAELMKRVGVKQVSFDPQKGDRALREMLAEAGVKVVYGDTRSTNIEAKYTIDATRSGVYARARGAKFYRGFEGAGPRGEEFTLAVSPIFRLRGMSVEDWLKLERKLDPKSKSQHYKGTDYLDVRSDAIGLAYHQWRKIQYDKALKPGGFQFDRGNIAIMPDGSLSVNALLFGVGAKRAVNLSDNNRVPADIRNELMLVEQFFKHRVSNKVTLETPRELYVRHTGNILTDDMVTRAAMAQSPGPFVGTYALDVRGVHGPGALGADLGGPVVKYKYGTEGTRVKGVDNLYVVGAAAGYSPDVVGIGRIEEFNIGKAGLLGKKLAEAAGAAKPKPKPDPKKLTDAERTELMAFVRAGRASHGPLVLASAIDPPKKREVALPIASRGTRPAATDHGQAPRGRTHVQAHNGSVVVKNNHRRAAVDHGPQGGGVGQAVIDHLYNWAVRAGL